MFDCNGSGSGQTASANDKTLVNTDFDEFRGWVSNADSSLSNRQAHSGRYSLTVGGGREYGMTFKYPLGELAAVKPRTLHVQAWVRVEETTTPAQLVVEVTKPVTSERVFWRGVHLFGGSKPGKWTKLETDLVMPDNIAFDQILGVYMWGNGAQKPVYLDDLRITSGD
ncbi:carbohydrate binding domain-containing protein [Hymenobacter roseosalivarius]|uniref:carbohydrate binding domain-containing protein n=1 Tax=Hymenobacter roseosalivarius TaxID=89967 RepID=UPI0009FE3D25|nr:carbohydrate binding domain-containing protein [Hymenobacter roseosalivarius]